MRASALLLLIAFAHTASGSPDGSPELQLGAISIEVSVVGDDPQRPAVVLTPRDGTGEPVIVSETESFPLVRKAPRTLWDISCGDGWWCDSTPVEFPDAGSTASVSLRAFRTATIRGTLHIPPDATVPADVKLTTEENLSSPSSSRLRRGLQFACSVAEDRSFTCSAPATTLDVALRARGFAPVYLWGLDTTHESEIVLPRVALRPGGSLIAWIDRRIAASVDKPATAKLYRSVAPVASEEAAKSSMPVAEAVISRQGWFQLGSLPPGVFVLEVEAPGFAPSTVDSIRVFEGKETSIRKLIDLHPPVRLTVSVTPATNTDGQAWSLDLAGSAGFGPSRRAIARLKARLDGEAVFPAQPPGVHTLRILDSHGSVVWSEDVELVSDHTMAVTLSLVAVSGQATLGDDPLEADLWFGGTRGAPRIAVRSAADGRFTANLPRQGKWLVEVISKEESIHGSTEVAVNPGEPIKVTLPNTSVSGRVETETGERIDTGSVIAIAGERAVSIAVGEGGGYRLRGLPVGRATLSAREDATGDSSPPRMVDLRHGDEITGLDLRIARAEEFSGRVTSALATVSGAGVTVIVRGDGANRVLETSTDGNGDFRVRVPAATKAVTVIIAAPGGTLYSTTVSRSGEPVGIDVPVAGGVVEVAASEPFSLSQGGSPLPLQNLVSWVWAHGKQPGVGALTVPDLAPGAYEACNRQRRCVTGLLAPGGSLRLEVPASQ